MLLTLSFILTFHLAFLAHAPRLSLPLSSSDPDSPARPKARQLSLPPPSPPRAVWRGIEQNLPSPQAYGLNEVRLAQFNRGMADVTAALTRLSDALRGTDNAALLKAAAALKPPFSRTFTAFGRYN